MASNSLEAFISDLKSVWGPLSSELVAYSQSRMHTLLQAPTGEDWLADLQSHAPENKELYRDSAHGFVLLAHAESSDRYRPPHDHGRGWVIYGVQKGEMEVQTYARVTHPDDGRTVLVRRETYRVRAGEARVYLPGDIHDTRCAAGSLLLRFLDRDLTQEEREGHAITRYVERGGVWTIPRGGAGG